LAKVVLPQFGYKVTALSDSQKALDIFTQNPESFDLLITDQTMPILLGSELIREIQSITPGFPVILCTGNTQHITHLSKQELSSIEICKKPVAKLDLANKIRKTLDNA